VNSASLLLWIYSFCYSELSHFTTVNSVILLQWTQSFYYSDQLFCDLVSHFVIVNSTILIDWTQLFLWFLSVICYSEFNYFLLLQSQPFCYSAQIFYIFSVILEIMSVIFATWLNHFTKLLSHSQYSSQPFSKMSDTGVGVRVGAWLVHAARLGWLCLLGMQNHVVWGAHGMMHIWLSQSVIYIYIWHRYSWYTTSPSARPPRRVKPAERQVSDIWTQSNEPAYRS
jgi:hypothetical protein